MVLHAINIIYGTVFAVSSLFPFFVVKEEMFESDTLKNFLITWFEKVKRREGPKEPFLSPFRKQQGCHSARFPDNL